MQLEKPKIQRSYVTITDAETKKRIHRTVYGSTPEQVLEALGKGVRDDDIKPARRRRDNCDVTAV